MRCYNCGCELAEYDFCTNCGADVGLYKKIIRTSNFFYNQGLERAKVRDLSGSVISLRQSLKFNKNNIKARNLLGLVYFEMGEVTAALSEWVISMNLRSKKNVAADYVDRVKSSGKKIDTFNQAIKKYNKALEYCHQPDGVDMAVIQLKSVLGMMPNFIRAHLLLALCYLKTNKPELARREAEKCRAIDVNNTMALRYIAEAERMLNPTEDPKKKKEDKKDEASSVVIGTGVDAIIQPVGVRERRGSTTVLNILVGIAIGFAVAFFLVLPARIQAAKSEVQEQVVTIGNQLDAKNITIDELERKNSDQAAKIQSLTESLSAYAGTEGTLQAMESLLKAASIYLEDNTRYLEVADYITNVDVESWTDDTSENYKSLYQTLKEAIGPEVCVSYYGEGLQAYKSKQFDDAIAYLEAAVFFDSQNVDALYQLALSYDSNGKDEAAKAAYTKVTELFPGTWHASKAAQALKQF